MTIFKIVLFRFVAALVVATLLATAAQAEPIRLDFADTRSVPTSPGTWNTLVDKAAGTSIADLLDSAGNTTGIGVSVTNAFSFEGTLGGDWGGTPIWAVKNATDDNFSTGSTGEITFTGLTDSAYDFSVISSRSEAGTRSGTFLIEGDAPGNHSGTFCAYTDGWLGRKVMTWTNVAPDDDGEITLWVSAVSGQLGYLSAMSFHMVPEPGTLALLSCGGIMSLLLLAVRRKRR